MIEIKNDGVRKLYGTQPTEQTEPQPTTEAGEEIAIPDTSEPTEAEN